MKFLIDILLFLAPPTDNDPVKLYQWQWKSVGMGIAAIFLASYAASFLPWVKPSYAMSEDVRKMKTDLQGKLDSTNRTVAQIAQQLKDGQIRSLNTDLIDAKRYQCRGINSDDKSSLPFWNNRLQSLKLAYFNLTGAEWPDLPCNSF